ncbi:MAG: alpha/beta hydrolase, partial [bacterium]|nr:alpha/beta hydrolase [bacterium]
IQRWLVFGGSWGSTLALAYGQAHPRRCLGFVLRGVFLGRRREVDWFLHSMGAIFPEALRDLRYASTLDVSNPLVAYQVACGYSLVASQIGEAAAEELPPNDFPTQSQILGAAMKWYSYSVQIRPDVAEIAKTDPDLAWLRNQPVFPKSRQSSESKS